MQNTNELIGSQKNFYFVKIVQCRHPLYLKSLENYRINNLSLKSQYWKRRKQALVSIQQLFSRVFVQIKVRLTSTLMRINAKVVQYPRAGFLHMQKTADPHACIPDLEKH